MKIHFFPSFASLAVCCLTLFLTFVSYFGLSLYGSTLHTDAYMTTYCKTVRIFALVRCTNKSSRVSVNENADWLSRDCPRFVPREYLRISLFPFPREKKNYYFVV